MRTAKIGSDLRLTFFPPSFLPCIGGRGHFSASDDAGGYARRQNNLELHLGCHTC